MKNIRILSFLCAKVKFCNHFQHTNNKKKKCKVEPNAIKMMECLISSIVKLCSYLKKYFFFLLLSILFFQPLLRVKNSILLFYDRKSIDIILKSSFMSERKINVHFTNIESKRTIKNLNEANGKIHDNRREETEFGT